MAQAGRLQGKVAVVTGAGAGIGEAIALRFAQEGARLVINDINQQNAQSVVQKVQALGVEAVSAAADISREEGARTIAEQARQAFGRVDVLVNNAADFTQKNIEAASVEDWQRVLGVNVIGVSLVSKYCLPLMRPHGGSVVNIASMSGIIAQPNFSTYSSSKGAVLMLTRTMALDLAPDRIRVNSISPGCVVTGASHREVERLGMSFEDWYGGLAKLHMLGRLGEPNEVANPVLFLASDESSFITGANLMVDGGYTAM